MLFWIPTQKKHRSYYPKGQNLCWYLEDYLDMLAFLFLFSPREGEQWETGIFEKEQKHVEHGTNDLRLVSFASAVIMIEVV